MTLRSRARGTSRDCETLQHTLLLRSHDPCQQRISATVQAPRPAQIRQCPPLRLVRSMSGGRAGMRGDGCPLAGEGSPLGKRSPKRSRHEVGRRGEATNDSSLSLT